jgi:hypothetical protein
MELKCVWMDGKTMKKEKGQRERERRVRQWHYTSVNNINNNETQQ